MNHFYIVYYQEGSGELYPYVYETTTKKKQGNIFSGVSTKIMGITLVQRNRPPSSQYITKGFADHKVIKVGAKCYVVNVWLT